jgi:hypothetical protein
LLPFCPESFVFSSLVLKPKVKVERFVILVYGCESCSFIVREKYKLKMIQKYDRVSRRMFGIKREKVTAERGEIT